MIIFSKNYKPSNTSFHALHHVGGLLNKPHESTIHFIAEQVNQSHKSRWNFIDIYTGKYGGYTFFYDMMGNRTQFRAVGAETAANKNWNYDGVVISHCFAGNFTKHPITGALIDYPTGKQIESYQATLKELNEAGVKVILENHKPHRFFNQTECYGNGLTDEWAKEISKGFEAEDERMRIQKLIDLIYLQLLELKKLLSLKLGGSLPKCEDSARD